MYDFQCRMVLSYTNLQALAGSLEEKKDESLAVWQKTIIFAEKISHKMGNGRTGTSSSASNRKDKK